MPVQPLREPVVLDVGQMLEHAAKRHRRGADLRLQPGRVESAALPRQGRALVLQEAEEGGGLVAREGRFRAAVLVDGHGLNRDFDQRAVLDHDVDVVALPVPGDLLQDLTPL